MTPTEDLDGPAQAQAQTLKPEESLLACCLLDEGATLDRAISLGLKPHHFTTTQRRDLFSSLLQLRAEGQPVTMEVLAARLMEANALAGVGGFPELFRLTDINLTPTTTYASHHIRAVLDASERGRMLREAQRVVERLKSSDDLGEIGEHAKRISPDIKTVVKTTPRTPFSFSIPPHNDSSILLGNRYLNRGDGLVITSSSGMGKSSMQMQMAGEWALARDFHGIKPNGPMTSLVIQSEDSDGDIAEVWQSLKHAKKWTAGQCQEIDSRVKIISEKSLRGAKFIQWLKEQVEATKPDLVWLNPLQAFIDGDVTDSKDLGQFLREGLNGINKDGRFGYVIIHHTTKPATGRDKTERQWHEVMYDMAGGAEIINWARGIISVRAMAEAGKFKVVLAKRGRRAGVTREVEQGIGSRLEPVMQFGLQHASGFIPGTSSGLICWEPYDLPTDQEVASMAKGGGRPQKYDYGDYRNLFPAQSSQGSTISQLHRILMQNGEIKPNILHNVCKRWKEQGHIEVIDVPGQPHRYRAIL